MEILWAYASSFNFRIEGRPRKVSWEVFLLLLFSQEDLEERWIILSQKRGLKESEEWKWNYKCAGQGPTFVG